MDVGNSFINWHYKWETKTLSCVCVFEVQQWSLTEEGEVRALCLSEQAPLTRNSSLWALTVNPDASFPPPFTPAYRDEEYMGWVVVVSVLTPQWLGWVTKKWPHVWRDG